MKKIKRECEEMSRLLSDTNQLHHTREIKVRLLNTLIGQLRVSKTETNESE